MEDPLEVDVVHFQLTLHQKHADAAMSVYLPVWNRLHCYDIFVYLKVPEYIAF